MKIAALLALALIATAGTAASAEGARPCGPDALIAPRQVGAPLGDTANAKADGMVMPADVIEPSKEKPRLRPRLLPVAAPASCTLNDPAALHR